MQEHASLAKKNVMAVSYRNREVAPMSWVKTFLFHC